MGHKFIITLGAAVALFNAACGRQNSSPASQAQPEHELHWLTDFDAAKTQARTQNKRLLINFTGSDWCQPCIRLNKQVFRQPEFSEYAAKNLVLLEVDFPRTKKQSPEQQAANEKLANQFGVEGFPTVFLLDANGQPLGELGSGAGGPKPFIAGIEKVRGADGTSIPSR